MQQAIIIFLLAAGIVSGDTMTFTISGTGSGHWGNQTFTNAAFTFSFFLPDADSLLQPSCCVSARSTPPGTSGTVTVAGFGTSGFGPNGTQAIYVNPGAGIAGIWHYNLADFLTVASPALYSYGLSTTIGPVSGTTFAYSWPLDLGSGVGLAFTAVTNVTFSAQRGSSGGIPTVVSMSPAFGNSSTGAANAFQFTIADTAGVSDLQGMNVQFSDAKLNQTGDPYACWLWFQRADSTLSAYQNGNWKTVPLGSGGSILSGDSCTIDTTAAAVTSSGNQLTLSLPVTFLNHPTDPDTMTVYVRAANNENVDSGYQQAGTFTVYPGASPNFMMSVAPALRDVAVGSDALYTVTVVPKSGFSDTVTFSGNVSVSGATTSFAPPSVTGAGTSTLTVTTSGIPDSVFPPYLGGGYPVFVNGTSPSGTVSQSLDLNVEVGPPTITATPRLISGTSYVYTVSVNDILAYSNWATGITGFNLLIGTSLNGANACWVFYDGTTLWLASDDGSAWTSAGTLGTTQTAQNSQCTVGGPAGSPGPRLIPHVGWVVMVPVTFSPDFAAKTTYTWARTGNAAGFDTGYFLEMIH